MQTGSWVGRFGGVLVHPCGAFGKWPEKAPFWPPALALMGFNLILSLIALPKVKAAALLALEQSPVPAGSPQLAMATTIINYGVPAMAILGALAIPLVIWVLEAVAISLVGRVFFGLQATYGDLLPVTVVAWVPALLGGLIQTVLLLSLPPEALNQIQLSLAALLPPAPHPGVGYLLLEKINPFTIWNFLLLGMGTAAIARVEQRRGLTVVFVIWLVYVVFSVALGMAGAAFSPAAG
ncbi:MAG: hypothetical protein PWP41_2040 [Moorella sp. (in: firmicutes)]|nr:hypothetical protein [Moorella sp. (in: firmicutes)]